MTHRVVSDYYYELSDAQLRLVAELSALERLRWLDDARRFTLLMRDATQVAFRDGVAAEQGQGERRLGVTLGAPIEATQPDAPFRRSTR